MCDLSNFCIIWLISEPLKADVRLQFEAKHKMLVRSVTFMPKSVEKHFQQQFSFDLTIFSVL